MANKIQNGGELAHYGILGMKWGVRRSPAQLLRTRGIGVVGTKKEKKPIGTLEENPKRNERLPIGTLEENPKRNERLPIGTKYANNNAGNTNHDDYKKAHSNKSAKSMSDKELRDRINRLQMEQQYSQLNKKKVSKGKKFVEDVLVNSAKQTATQYVTKYMTKGIDVLISKASKK